jgi:hypothetical protein
MGQYSKTTVADGGAITHTHLNTELGKIETAHNTHATGDFAADCVPDSAVAKSEEYRYFTLQLDSGITQVTGAVALGTDAFDNTVVPCDCTLVDIDFICLQTSANGTEYVDVYELTVPTSILSAKVGLAAPNTRYTGTISTTSFSAHDRLSLRLELAGAGPDTVTKVKATLLFKADV